MTGEVKTHRCASVPLISSASDAKVSSCAALQAVLTGTIFLSWGLTVHGVCGTDKSVSSCGSHCKCCDSSTGKPNIKLRLSLGICILVPSKQGEAADSKLG